MDDRPVAEQLRSLLRDMAGEATMTQPTMDGAVRRGRRRIARSGVVCLTVVAVVGYGIVAGVRALPRGGTLPASGRSACGWTIHHDPDPFTGETSFRAVTLEGGSDAWVAGYDFTLVHGFPDDFRAQVARWNGRQLTLVDVPRPHGNYTSLKAIAPLAPNDLWMGGSYFAHWDGSTWLSMPAPVPPGANGFSLDGMAGTSRSNVWAVGFQDHLHGNRPQLTTLADHWDGTSWSVTDTPNPPSGQGMLLSMSAISASDAWAVGTELDPQTQAYLHTLVERWDGSAWKIVPSPDGAGPNSALNGVVAIGPDDAWAVGSYGKAPTYEPLIEHWDGKGWSVVTPAPVPGSRGGLLNALAADPAHGVWAAGAWIDATTGTQVPLIERWDGAAWRFVASPRPAPTNTSHALDSIAVGDGVIVTTGHGSRGEWDSQAFFESCVPRS